MCIPRHVFCFRPAIYLSRLRESVIVRGSALSVSYFRDMNTLNVALRDPKVKRTKGKLHMMAHDNLATRDESVKRGGGSVTVLRNSQNIIKVPSVQIFR